MSLLISISAFSQYDNSSQGAFIEFVENNSELYTGYSEKISKITETRQVKNLRIARIRNPFERQIDGKLSFTSNSTSLKSRLLRVRQVKYTSKDKYYWHGKSYDNQFDITIIKNSTGICGYYEDHEDDISVTFIPLDSIYSVLFEVEDIGLQCGNQNETEEILPLTETCDDEGCIGHIDILFLIPPAVNMVDPISEFSIIMSQLEAAFKNSNIKHTVSFNYTYTTFNNWSGFCVTDVTNLSLYPEVSNLQNQYGADIVVVVAPNNAFSWFGCVKDIGPNTPSSIALFRYDQIFTEYVFVHEIGHIFGGIHYNGSFPPQQSHLHADCASSHEIPINKETLMGVQKKRILHFSDPNIQYLGNYTGLIDRNNAGRIRNTGCKVSNFTQSNNLNTNIQITPTQDCQLMLEKIVDDDNPNYQYIWYWNTSGIFLGPNPNNLLGQGALITITEPVVDPCVTYFIHLRVTLNGNIVALATVSQDGGICTENVQPCGHGNPVFFMPIKVENSKQLSLSQIYDTENRINETKISEYHLYNILGQPLGVFKNKGEISTLGITSHNGIYILCTITDNIIVKTEKIIFINK